MVIDYHLPRRSPSLLSQVRYVLADEETTVNVICNYFLRNVRNVEYMVFEKRGFDGSVRVVASLVSKRGNEKYAYNVRRRLNELMYPFEEGYDILPSVVDGQTSVLHLDLTYDAKKVGNKQSWARVGVDFNRYLSNLKRKFGRLHVGRTWEAHASGVVHIHAIIVFLEYSFEVFSWFSKKSKGYVLRVSDLMREKLRSHWVALNDFVNIQGIPNLRDGLRYLTKHITKASDLALNDSKNKGLKTLASAWAFRKRCFSFGRKFKDSIFRRYLSVGAYDLNKFSVIQTFSEQVTLDNPSLEGMVSLAGLVGLWFSFAFSFIV